MTTPIHEREGYVDLCKQAGVCPHSAQVETDDGVETVYCEVEPGEHEDYLGFRCHEAGVWGWASLVSEPS